MAGWNSTHGDIKNILRLKTNFGPWLIMCSLSPVKN